MVTEGGTSMHYYWNGQPWDGTDVFFGLLMSILWIVLIVWVVRTVIHSRHLQHHDQTPLDIAKTRYAKGEISKEQYEELQRDLKQ